MGVREVQALQQLSGHPNIVSYENAFFSEATRSIFIVTEFVRGSHLFSHLVQRCEPLLEHEVSFIMAQLSDALSFCHTLGVVHRDLKLENVLVSNVSLRLAQRWDPGSETSVWQSEELFSVKLCDFGFAKSLRKYTTQTPLGTNKFVAPEVLLHEKSEKSSRPGRVDGDGNGGCTYDAFKADAYSLGVMMYSMLCLNVPMRDDDPYAYREHKHWANLTDDAKYIIDSTLELDPVKRMSVVDVSHHAWVKMALELEEGHDERTVRRSRSKESVLSSVEIAKAQAAARIAEVSSTRDSVTVPDAPGLQRRSPVARWQGERQDPLVPGTLALHRALVHIQQERAMACWALGGHTPGLGGIDCWEQLQWHFQVTERQLNEAKTLLVKSSSNAGLVGVTGADKLLEHLTKARSTALRSPLRRRSSSNLSDGACGRSASCSSDLSTRSSGAAPPQSHELFDIVCASYNDACGELIEIVVRLLLHALSDCPEGRRAVRRYRLCCAAAEQLARERAIMCGHEDETDPNVAIGAASSDGEAQDAGAAAAATMSSLPTTPRSLSFEELPMSEKRRHRLYNLLEIIGTRKFLLGTVEQDLDDRCSSHMSTADDPLRFSDGFVAPVIGSDEPPLLSRDELLHLEALEKRVLYPILGDVVPTEEWYQELTRFLNELHNRIVVSLVQDMRGSNAAQSMESALGFQIKQSVRTADTGSTSVFACCRTGVKLLLAQAAQRLVALSNQI
eukprot:TRINITY_DN22466_c1_g2_i1.p1 TRINITY_DN22466_c1_g2~~TRINITY_DN22466_c1_g2_i1.p1  ORF type:complete len:860 (-),score=162.16 TRINITY_DN22466_c1_g2_i1:50-2245(-)